MFPWSLFETVVNAKLNCKIWLKLTLFTLVYKYMRGETNPPPLKYWRGHILLVMPPMYITNIVGKDIDLHWLPVEYRVHYKVALYVYKALNGIAPAYIAVMVNLYMPSRKSLRSSSKKLIQQKAMGWQIVQCCSRQIVEYLTWINKIC